MFLNRTLTITCGCVAIETMKLGVAQMGNRSLRPLATGAALILSAGCSQTLPTPTYQPASLTDLTGAVAVREFKYASRVPMEPNQLHTNTPATWLIEQPVATYFATAVKREFRQAGISIAADAGCDITGEIRDLLADPVGEKTGADVHYQLSKAGTMIWNGPIVTSGSMPWAWDPNDIMTAAGNAISANITKLIDDPAFQSAVKQGCQA
jgi:hypothetical protein